MWDKKLSTSLGPIKLKNPFLIGAGPVSMYLDDIKRAEEEGAGGVIIKSIGWHHSDTPITPQDIRRYKWIKGYGNYLKSTYLKEILPMDYGMGLIEKSKKQCDIPIIASLFYPYLFEENSIDVWLKLFKEAEQAGADGIQIDFFYLNLKKMCETDICRMIEIINQLALSVNIPIFPKLNIRMDDDLIDSMITNCHIGGLIYLDSINVQPYIDIHNRGKPIFDGNLYDSLTGASTSVVAGEPLLPFTFNYTQILRSKTNLSLSAGGGLDKWQDIIRCLMLGANSVHLTSVFMKKGFKHIKGLKNNLNKFLDENEYNTLSDLIGISLEHYPKLIGKTKSRETLQVKTMLLENKCIQCNICENMVTCNSFKSIPYNFDQHCDGCSMCHDLCPRKALVYDIH